MVNATCRYSSRISIVSGPRRNKIGKDQWEFISQEAGSHIFHLVMRLGLCAETFAAGE